MFKFAFNNAILDNFTTIVDLRLNRSPIVYKNLIPSAIVSFILQACACACIISMSTMAIK